MQKLKPHAKKTLKIKQTKNPNKSGYFHLNRSRQKNPNLKKQSQNREKKREPETETEKETPHLLSPSSKIVCSSAVHSTERPGLCFSAWADPELSDAPAFVAPKLPLLVFLLPPPPLPPPPLKEDEALLPSWFPDGFALAAIKKENPVLRIPKKKIFLPLFFRQFNFNYSRHWRTDEKLLRNLESWWDWRELSGLSEDAIIEENKAMISWFGFASPFLFAPHQKREKREMEGEENGELYGYRGSETEKPLYYCFFTFINISLINVFFFFLLQLRVVLKKRKEKNTLGWIWRVLWKEEIYAYVNWQSCPQLNLYKRPFFFQVRSILWAILVNLMQLNMKLEGPQN